MANINYRREPAPMNNIAAVAAMAAAVGSVFLSCSGRGFGGLLLALAGVIVGVIGFFRSASASRRGGILSISAVVISLLAVVPAILAMLGKLIRHL